MDTKMENKSKYSKKSKDKSKYSKKSKDESKNLENSVNKLDNIKDKIKKKANEKKEKKTDRTLKLQEKKKIRVQQKNEKKIVSDMVEILRDIFPFFIKNDYYRKYFNINQFLKLEMFDDLQKIKEEYNGNNNIFIPFIDILLKKVYLIINPRLTENEFIADMLETSHDKFDELVLLYIKG
jgi:hypothetical protein